MTDQEIKAIRFTLKHYARYKRTRIKLIIMNLSFYILLLAFIIMLAAYIKK